MIDIHSHILFGIDDGAKTIEETIQILKEAQVNGITDIILTPHYIENYYDMSKEEVSELIAYIKMYIKNNGIDININLFQGNEIYLCENIEELIKNNKVSTLNNTKYILIEIPRNGKLMMLSDIIFKLVSFNKIPILAHPERYTIFQKEPELLIELIEQGMLCQANLGSIIGLYGREAKKTLIRLLQADMIHFLASDVHFMNTIYSKKEKIFEVLNKYLSEKSIKLLTEENPRKILEEKEIEFIQPNLIKKQFSFFKKS